MAWYDTGTVSVTNGSATVTGSSTNFVAGAQVGEGFYGPDGRLYEIQAIVSATSLTLADNYLGSTQSGQSYKIVPTQSLVADLASQVSTLISDFQTVADEAGEGKFDDGSAASPGITFTQDQDTGFFRETANEIGIAVAGSKIGEFNSSGLSINLVNSGDFNVDSGTFFVDASTDRVGVNTPSPSEALSVVGNVRIGNGGTYDLKLAGNTTPAVTVGGSTVATVFSTFGTNTASGHMGFEIPSNDGNDGFYIATDADNDGVVDTLAMKINAAGNVGIGTATPSERLDVVGNVEVNGDLIFNGAFRSFAHTADNLGIQILGSSTNTSGSNIALFGKNNATQAGNLILTSGGATGVGETIFRRRTDSAFITSMTIDSSGDVSIVGALSKGSGSFKIDHPLKPETHHLVHSFVESPQADNIYRGTAVLVDGQATVNLDTAGRMSEGTFAALNGNIQCFTSNEDGWTAVRGSVSGNILTIEAQDNTCTDTVSWMVVGERIDQHMIDASWTDDNGRVITEPLKPETPE